MGFIDNSYLFIDITLSFIYRHLLTEDSSTTIQHFMQNSHKHMF